MQVFSWDGQHPEAQVFSLGLAVLYVVFLSSLVNSDLYPIYTFNVDSFVVNMM